MKKIKPPERKTGIWLDQENAFIIQITGMDEPAVRKIRSNVESRIRYKGEGKVFARSGNSYISDEEKKQHRQRNQRQMFFKEIVRLVHGDDYLYVFGPGRAREGLINTLEKVPLLKAKVTALEAADKMTAEQAKAATMHYFKGPAFKAFKRQLRLMRKRAGVM
jgi:hypothetical protein